ncbi:MAG: pectate lyase family protein [Gammaproteobacteria bacterium]
MRRLPNIVFLGLAVTGFSGSAAALPAFPGAQGFGTQTPGGRGGRVIEVTNLNDSGSGSLRAALEASGARTVVFRIGGTIVLKSQIKIKYPYITVAGQTAPGGGITLRNTSDNTSTPIRILTHDVVIRYIRSRPGPNKPRSDKLDALAIGTGYNIVIDHVSTSWGTDEVLSTGSYKSTPKPHDITIQWSIVAEGLGTDSSAGKGTLIYDGAKNISLHHNLWAHNMERNPRIKTTGIIDIVNNVIYNPGFHGSWGPSHSTPDTSDGNNLNYVGNYYKPGANSGTGEYLVSAEGPADIYVADNYVPHKLIRPGDGGWIVGTRRTVPAVATTDPETAFAQVLQYAGATLPMRDDVDTRIINDVKNGTGKCITDPAQVGGWPELAAGTAPDDSDHDGMPNTWEAQHGFNAADAKDGAKDADGDGYTNVEEYLNGTDPHA